MKQLSRQAECGREFVWEGEVLPAPLAPYVAQNWNPHDAQQSPAWMPRCVYMDWGQSVEGSAVCNSFWHSHSNHLWSVKEQASCFALQSLARNHAAVPSGMRLQAEA